MTVIRERRNGRRRVVMIVAGVLALFLASGTAGYAYWQLQGNATINVPITGVEQINVVSCGFDDTQYRGMIGVDYGQNIQHSKEYGGIKLVWHPLRGARGYKVDFLFKSDVRLPSELTAGSYYVKQPSFWWGGSELQKILTAWHESAEKDKIFNREISKMEKGIYPKITFTITPDYGSWSAQSISVDAEFRGKLDKGRTINVHGKDIFVYLVSGKIGCA